MFCPTAFCPTAFCTPSVGGGGGEIANEEARALAQLRKEDDEILVTIMSFLGVNK